MSREFEDDVADAYRQTATQVDPPPDMLKYLALATRLLIDHPPPDDPGAYLLLARGGEAPSLIRLDRDLRAGRSPDADITIDHPFVSSLHCQLRHDGEDWELLDLGSKNGTLVNGRRRVRRLLCAGDVVQLGDTILVYVEVEP